MSDAMNEVNVPRPSDGLGAALERHAARQAEMNARYSGVPPVPPVPSHTPSADPASYAKPDANGVPAQPNANGGNL